jgi:hypothetical protein
VQTAGWPCTLGHPVITLVASCTKPLELCTCSAERGMPQACFGLISGCHSHLSARLATTTPSLPMLQHSQLSERGAEVPMLVVVKCWHHNTQSSQRGRQQAKVMGGWVGGDHTHDTMHTRVTLLAHTLQTYQAA